MRCLLLLCLAGTVIGHPSSDSSVKEKGFIDWITNLIGGVSSTTLRPIDDPKPETCPNCREYLLIRNYIFNSQPKKTGVTYGG